MAKEEKIKEQETVKDDNTSVEVIEKESIGKKPDSSKGKKRISRKEKNLDKELKEKKIALAESKDKFIRLYSEFENFRRRTSKERLELISTANEGLLTDLLPVLDDFERAIQSMNNEESTSELAMEGINLIYNKFKSITDQKGLRQMEISQGDDFDSDLHDAIARIPVENKKLNGKIVDITEKGYFLDEKVIRHAKVVIGS